MLVTYLMHKNLYFYRTRCDGPFFWKGIIFMSFMSLYNIIYILIGFIEFNIWHLKLYVSCVSDFS